MSASDFHTLSDRLEKLHNHMVELLDVPFLNGYAIDELQCLDDFLINIYNIIWINILHGNPKTLTDLSRIAPPNLTHIGDPQLYDKFKIVAQIYDETLQHVISDMTELLPMTERFLDHPLLERFGLRNFHFLMNELRQYLTTNAEDV